MIESVPLVYSLSFNISESSHVGDARRNAVKLAESIGLPHVRQGEIALIITEAANNLIRHTAGGELFVRILESNGNIGMEIVCVDNGPGMTSVSQCMRDGYSTAGTAGNGLGAIARLSHHLDIYTLPGCGTVLRALVWSAPPLPVSTVLHNEYGVVSRPKPGQEVCGDSWAVELGNKRCLYFLADGLGHGPDAAIASQEAVRTFRKYKSYPPKVILEAVHEALQRTRGVAAAVAEILHEEQIVCFAGIGNIAAVITSGSQCRTMLSHNGIVGHQIRKIQEFHYPWSDAFDIMIWPTSI